MSKNKECLGAVVNWQTRGPSERGQPAVVVTTVECVDPRESGF